MNKKISVCIICKNEETKIKKCLESVLWADEIIIVDAGSSDKTLDIVKNYTSNIHIRDDWQGFGLQRRRAEELATNDWLFTLDSDEVVSEELAQEIRNAVNHATTNQVFSVNRLTHFCGQFIYHSGWYPDRIARIYNKNHYRYNDKMVHESLNCIDMTNGEKAKIHALKSSLIHYTFSNLSDYLAKRNRYAEAWAEQRFKRGKKGSLLKGFLAACFAFFRHYILRRGFLDGKVGVLIAMIQFQYTFNKYAILAYKNIK